MKVIKQARFWAGSRRWYTRIPRVTRGFWVCTTCGKQKRKRHFDMVPGQSRPSQPCRLCKNRLDSGWIVKFYHGN